MRKSRFRALALLVGGFVSFAAFSAETSEITVSLRLDFGDNVVGERIRGVVDVVNVSPETVSVGRADSRDRLFIEVFRADRSQLQKISDSPQVSPFFLKSNEGQKLETFLADHYGLRSPGRYLAKPVLVHGGVRFEGQIRAFDVVPGMRIGGALQMFSNHEGLRREFDLLTWSRGGREHLFLAAKDSGTSDRKWMTIDLGELMKITKPTISIMPTGEVVVLHRVDPDNFIRSELWSVPDGIEFHRRELVQDPETAGTNRIRELYRGSGGVKPKERSWWKFWD